jgi:hypothetical protein
MPSRTATRQASWNRCDAHRAEQSKRKQKKIKQTVLLRQTDLCVVRACLVVLLWGHTVKPVDSAHHSHPADAGAGLDLVPGGEQRCLLRQLEMDAWYEKRHFF